MSDSYTPIQGLILIAYNAYYNRFYKYEDSLQNYLDNSEGSDYLIKNVNFNPADGLNTIHIAGNGELDNRLDFRNYSFTYALLIEYNPALKTREEIYADEDTHILSKWFILDNDRTRGGQYKLTLRRDVLVDYRKQIFNSPVFVEKAILTNADSPLLFNNEDVRVNQIKKDEILLKDRTQCPWLVLYLKRGILGDNQSVTVDVPQNEDFVYKKLSTPITAWDLYQYVNNDYKLINFDVFQVAFNIHGSPASNYKFKFWDDSTNASWEDHLFAGDSNLYADDTDFNSIVPNAFIPQRTALKTSLAGELGYKITNALLEYNGKTIKDSDGKYFKITVIQNQTGTTNHAITTTDTPLTKAAMNTIWNNAFSQSVTANDKAFSAKTSWISYRIALEELTDVQTTIDFSYYEGTGTKDSMLFDAICMPYGDVRMYALGGLIDITTSAERSLTLMNSLATQLTSEKVLDFQILPYCPVQDLINPTIDKQMKFWVLKDTVLECVYNGNVSDLIIVCGSANFTFDISKNISMGYDDDVSLAIYKKFVNDCTKLRLCSPNYNGVFEMNLAKNGGEITKFNVDMTLRPYNPYIHVNPDFKFLYGEDFNDQRGLICGGDFSLGIINDAWNVYEIQNKNYQAIFDRQIQNLDVNNAIARQEAGWGIAAGTVSGAASGAAGGAIVGGGYGAIAGAIIGAGTSAVGGALDWANLQKRQQEQRSYAIDNYNLQLGNVQALPYSITKTSALTYNNKMFPFVEIYECTEEEKQAYYQKIIWNGMTIGIIDVIKNYESGYWANYFRGKLIALYNEEGSNSVENRIIEAINEELMKGVFI